MPSINDIVNSFDIGFFSTNINTKNPIRLDVSTPPKLADFKDTLNVISIEPYNPPPPTKFAQLDGFRLDENNIQVPTKIILKGVPQQDLFLDENGNWDVEAEAKAYKERELEYKKDVIIEWVENKGYELQNKAELMKALLARTEQLS